MTWPFQWNRTCTVGIIETFETTHRKGIKSSSFGSSQWRFAGKKSYKHSRNRVYFQLSLPFFKNVKDSTRFQIENRNCGSTLLKNRVPASVGSGAESFKYPITRAKARVVKYPILRTNNQLQSKYPIPDEPMTKCNSRLQGTCKGMHWMQGNKATTCPVRAVRSSRNLRMCIRQNSAGIRCKWMGLCMLVGFHCFWAFRVVVFQNSVFSWTCPDITLHSSVQASLLTIQNQTVAPLWTSYCTTHQWYTAYL